MCVYVRESEECKKKGVSFCATKKRAFQEKKESFCATCHHKDRILCSQFGSQ